MTTRERYPVGRDYQLMVSALADVAKRRDAELAGAERAYQDSAAQAAGELARAILADPSILLLDEFTSAADAESEMEIHRALRDFMKGRTCFVITHRLNTLEMADRIIVMNQAVWDKLSADHKAALERATARRNADQLRKEIRGFEETLRGMHVQGGGQVVQVTAEQRGEWRKKLQPVWPQMVKEMGADGEAIYKVVEAGKQSCSK